MSKVLSWEGRQASIVFGLVNVSHKKKNGKLRLEVQITSLTLGGKGFFRCTLIY